MARLAPTDAFNPDTMAQPVTGIASRLIQHDSGMHLHDRGQLLFAYAGSIRLAMPGLMAVLPPIRVAWIPPGVAHRVQIRGEVEYRSIYLDPARIDAPVTGPAIFSMTALLREVFERISLEPFDTD